MWCRAPGVVQILPLSDAVIMIIVGRPVLPLASATMVNIVGWLVLPFTAQHNMVQQCLKQGSATKSQQLGLMYSARGAIVGWCQLIEFL
jgi:hypothetical protein